MLLPARGGRLSPDLRRGPAARRPGAAGVPPPQGGGPESSTVAPSVARGTNDRMRWPMLLLEASAASRAVRLLGHARRTATASRARPVPGTGQGDQHP